VGLVALSRAISGGDVDPAVFSVTATFSDATTAVLTSQVRRNTGIANGAADNTFFLFSAPANLGITSLTLGPTSAGRDMHVDEFGFTTINAIPEPASFLSVSLLAGLTLLRRR
jgi:hypothetical protein